MAIKKRRKATKKTGKKKRNVSKKTSKKKRKTTKKASRKKASKSKGSSKKTATKSVSTGKREKVRGNKRLYAIASPRSVGGVSMFDAFNGINCDTVQNFLSEADVTNRAVNRLMEAGFEVLQTTPAMINIAGTASQFQQAFNTSLYSQEREVIKEESKEDTAEFFDTAETDLPGLISTKATSFADVLEGIALEEPVYFMAPSSYPPLKQYWHLQVPSGISLGCNADRAHRAGFTGKGVKVAMVDSGWFKHPFFVNRGYRTAPVVLGPAASNPLRDESGHGTGESANIFSVAPDAELLPVKINFVNSVGAFNAAVGLNPHIITNSWGSHKPFGPLSAANQSMAAAIALAVSRGIIVIFSAGNGHAGFPGQHPDVISAGGVFMDVDESLQASNYSSGFDSTIYAGRRVPDLSGLVGMQPGASYIMLPLEPGCAIDVSKAGGTHPPGDETTPSDGWAAFSGTSAAAPQLAGAAALIKQACPALSPVDVRDILMRTARDVTTGTCNTVSPLHTGLAATTGPDTATGNGLVDAHKAALIAKIRCLGGGTPAPPKTPLPFVAGAAPAPTTAGSMTQPLSQPMQGGASLSAAEVEALESMIMDNDFD